MNITSGKLNRRVSIQTQSTAQDDFGQELATWTTAYTCWASIDIQNSALIYNTAEFMEDVTYRIECRWTSSFTFLPKQRIQYTENTTGNVHTYTIKAILNPSAGNRQVTLMCYELNGVE